MIAVDDTHVDRCPPEAECRVAALFDITGDVRFLSHHDELRMLARAVVRAGWPIAYSQGFNPQPRLRLPLPRSVGTAGTQWMLVDLCAAQSPVQLFASLTGVLPAGYRLLRLVSPAPRATPRAQFVTFQVTLRPEDARRAASRVARLAGSDPLPVTRTGAPGEAPRTVDIRPYIEAVRLDGQLLQMRLRMDQQRTARPTEILEELGLVDATHNLVRRGEIEWNIAFTGPSAGPVPDERNYFGNQVNQQEENIHPPESRQEGHPAQEGQQ